MHNENDSLVTWHSEARCQVRHVNKVYTLTLTNSLCTEGVSTSEVAHQHPQPNRFQFFKTPEAIAVYGTGKGKTNHVKLETDIV